MQTTAKRLPRLARILERYLKLFDPDAIQRIEFLQRSKLKGRRIAQLRAELERLKARRQGSTLVEVLIGLLIFSIGVLGVMSLFMLAGQKSAQATKLTHGTDLRYNAEAVIDLFPWIIKNPDRDPNGQAHRGEKFAFDPLGAVLMPPAMVGTFGGLKRYSGGWSTEAAATGLVSSPDSWIVQADGLGTNATLTSIDVPGLVGFKIPTGIACRASILDQNESALQTRPVVGVNGNTISWADPLPSGFAPGNARVELQDRRYTWLLTVRQNLNGDASVDVVVFFNRSFAASDEKLWPAGFFARATQVTVTCPPGTVRKGRYILDADNALWYRVQNAVDTGLGTCQVTLEVPAYADSPAVGGSAIVMRGIVDVYGLEMK